MASIHQASRGWADLCGIVPAHWDIVAGYARESGLIIFLRTGKPAAVRWIAEGFPGKPMALFFLKVDPELGLLLARTPEQRHQAAQAGYYTLVESDGGLKAARNQSVSSRVFRESWACADLVIDPESMLPLTSDYDLAALVDTKNKNYMLTFGAMAGTKNATNMYTESVSAELNARFRSRRILHGTQAQYSGDLSNKDEEGVLAFFPRGTVLYLNLDTILGSAEVLRDIIIRQHPEMAVSFHN